MAEAVEKRLERSPDRGDVLGLPVHLMDDYAGWLVNRVAQHQGTHVITLNAEMSMQASRSSSLAALIRQAELVVPDGAGIVLHFRLRGRVIARCPGIDLAEAVLSRSPHLQAPNAVFFYGGAPGVTQHATAYWNQRSPQVSIASPWHGFLTEVEQQELRDALRSLQPRLILVGLGVPRQEFWIAEHRHLCPNAVWIGVGGSFDIWAGTKPRAPEWFRKNHLEWAYRLYQEPWRWRRMTALPHFAWRSFRALLG